MSGGTPLLGTELGAYLPVLMVLVFAGGLAFVFLVASSFLGPKKPSPEKGIAYECGIDPVGTTRFAFSIRFYIIAMLFIMFDIEVVFLFPWAVLFRELGLFGLVEMGIFLFILVSGLAYVWKKGALEWE
ncbi:MAG: NADH-quinone oxidoreductase subunit A [Deltaproteobacteria bacterium RIFOXYA12_FULL_61_11]|nr:MAG: NADH-quinone oxidoreductase subunit A [Deltaproteobacteria bacterium RIFOXYA12_FULL_61_11]